MSTEALRCIVFDMIEEGDVEKMNRLLVCEAKHAAAFRGLQAILMPCRQEYLNQETAHPLSR